MSIKKRIKASWLGGFATYLGDIYSDPMSIVNFLRLRNLDKEAAVLIGTPAHYNLGDHLLALNEMKFLKEYCHFKKVIEIPTRIYEHNTKMLERMITKDVPIFITGGGWMGDVWPEDQLIIEKIIQSFNNNPIFILPQTIFYSDKQEKTIENTQKVFNGATNLTLMCRENASYTEAKELFANNVEIVLLPDMGLLQDYEDKEKKLNKRYILSCLRTDREQVLDKDFIDTINGFAQKQGYEVRTGSTLHTKPVPIWKRRSVLKKLMQEFRNADMVVTDRLHGMIFSVICGTRCVAFDNKTHKVSGVYEIWLKDKASVCVLEQNDEKINYEDFFGEVLTYECNKKWYENADNLFKKMAIEINRKLLKSEEL